MLYHGIRWEFLPQEWGFGSGMTCWRWLRDWNVGVWQRLLEVLLAEFNAVGALDWSRAAVDGSRVRAMKGGPRSTGPSPVDRGRAGSKHPVLVEGHGIPLAVSLTGGNRNDVTQLLLLVEAVPVVRGRRGRARRRPDKVYADRGYDHDKYRKVVRARTSRR